MIEWSKDNLEMFFDETFSFLTQQMLNDTLNEDNEHVIGKEARTAYKILRRFALDPCDLDICLSNLGDVFLGFFDNEESIIELNRDIPFNERVLTLAHEIGHFLTFSDFRPGKHNEILAEMFSYLAVFFLGLRVSGYYYLQKMRDKSKYIKRKKTYLRKVFYEFAEWVIENYGEKVVN